MASSIDIGVSGVNAAATQLQNSANNVANQFSTQTNENGKTVNKPYVPQRVDQVSQKNGGVTTQTRPVNPPTVQAAGGAGRVPNVDVAQEAVNQAVASYDFQANLKTIQAANQDEKKLLDIKS